MAESSSSYKDRSRQKKTISQALRRDRKDLESNPSLAYLAEKRLREAGKQQSKEAYPSPPSKQDKTWTYKQRKKHCECVVDKYLKMSHSEEEGTIFGVPVDLFKSWPAEQQVQRVKDWKEEQEQRVVHQEAHEIMLRRDQLHQQYTQAHQQYTQAHRQHDAGSVMAVLQLQGGGIPTNMLQQWFQMQQGAPGIPHPQFGAIPQLGTSAAGIPQFAMQGAMQGAMQSAMQGAMQSAMQGAM